MKNISPTTRANLKNCVAVILSEHESARADEGESKDPDNAHVTMQQLRFHDALLQSSSACLKSEPTFREVNANCLKVSHTLSYGLLPVAYCLFFPRRNRQQQFIGCACLFQPCLIRAVEGEINPFFFY